MAVVTESDQSAERSDPTTSGPALEGQKSRPTALYVCLWAATIGLSLFILVGDIPGIWSGILSMLLLLLLLLTGIPIGIAMIVTSVICLSAVGGFRLAEISIQTSVFESVAQWSFSVIPLFTLMGIALWTAGLTDRAYGTARQWFGGLPGGLAVATNFAGAGLAASSGSSIAIVMSLGRMAIPEMLRSGYSPALATSSVAMAGTLGQIMPTSVLLVIYAGIAETSVGQQLMAALIPGLVLAAVFSAVIILWAVFSPASAPRTKLAGATWKSRLASTLQILPILAVVVVVVGGIFSGIFTVTEAGAIGAFVAVVMGALARDKTDGRGFRATIRYLVITVKETIYSISGLFLIIIGSITLTIAIARSGLAQGMSTWLISLDLGRVELLLVLIVVYLVLGMFLESLPMILLTVPILQAPLEAVGVDMVWYGIFLLIMCEVGLVFPPIGIITFVVHRIVKDPKTNLGTPIALTTIFKGIMPFVIAAIAALVAMIFWPEIALWLPSLTQRK